MRSEEIRSSLILQYYGTEQEFNIFFFNFAKINFLLFADWLRLQEKNIDKKLVARIDRKA